MDEVQVVEAEDFVYEEDGYEEEMVDEGTTSGDAAANSLSLSPWIGRDMLSHIQLPQSIDTLLRDTSALTTQQADHGPSSV